VALRGIKPTTIEKRLKLFLFGPPGSRKTTTGLMFPRTYLIDAERGAENDQYAKALEAGGGSYFFSSDLDDIIKEVSSLRVERHPYTTLLVDPITVPYSNACDEAARALAERDKNGGDGTEFGRHKALADRKMKRLCTLALQLDMTVIFTSHAKPKWLKDGDSFKEVGVTFDAYNKIDYVFDLVIETQLRGTEGWGIVRKSRIASLPVGDAFPLSYEALAERYGRTVLERGAEPVTLATPEQVERLKHLVATVKLNGEKTNEEIVQKWLDKADAETFADMSTDAVAKCIAYVESRIASPASPAEEAAK
jgi:AAA domain